MTVFSMPLNNSGDDVFLLDPDGAVHHSVSYEKSEVSPGDEILFD